MNPPLPQLVRPGYRLCRGCSHARHAEHQDPCDCDLCEEEP